MVSFDTTMKFFFSKNYPGGESDIVNEGKNVRGAKVEERKKSLAAV
jgi:hypothetical protein